MLNNEKRVKELEDDVKTLYSLIEHLQAKTKSIQTFTSFCINPIDPQEELYKEQIKQQMPSSLNPYSGYAPPYEPKYDEITVSSVVNMILKRMGVEIKYTPPVTPRNTPSKFKLVKKERGTV